MDRFKFRVWDKYLQGYVKENLGEEYVWIEDDGQLGAGIDDDSCILEQCTGLKDKNGNLIYEGDLIKSPSNSYPLEIVRMPNGVYGCKVCKIHPVWEMNLYSLINAYDVEIIGNIHEQAE